MSAMTGTLAPIREKSSRLSSTLAALAMAIKCNTAFVEPPNAMTVVIAFSKASLVMISRGFRSISIKFLIALAAFSQSYFLSSDNASWLLLPGSDMPMASIAEAMVFAVYIPPQEPGPLTEIFSIAISSSSEILPLANSPVFSHTVT